VYVLDTDSVSYFLKGTGRVGERLLAEPPSNVALPAVVVYELMYGAGRSQAPAGVQKAVDGLVETLPVLPFGESEARTAARIRIALERSGRPIGPLDLLIAATAVESGGILVTRNKREFGRIKGLRLEDWY